MSGLIAVQKLTAMGYRFQVEGDALCYEWQGTGKPDPGQVRPLLALVKEHKPEVLAYLSRPTSPERILTCFECGHFRSAVNSPNPTQAFGRCEKRGRGRYGVATACEAIMALSEAPGEAICHQTGARGCNRDCS
jgi:hypothetical protein